MSEKCELIIPIPMGNAWHEAWAAGAPLISNPKVQEIKMVFLAEIFCLQNNVAMNQQNRTNEQTNSFPIFQILMNKQIATPKIHTCNFIIIHTGFLTLQLLS